jgi:uncharacterized protein (DUF433 family)
MRHNQKSQFGHTENTMDRITLEPGKRGGRPCIRGLRITVYDVLSMLSSGMTQQEIQDDFPELTPEDILSVLAYAADREHQVYSLKAQ